MNAVAGARGQAAGGALPELAALTVRQQIRADCVWCGRRLGTRARPVGVVTDHGHHLPLAACVPYCRHDTTVYTLRRVLAGLRRLPDTRPPPAPPPRRDDRPAAPPRQVVRATWLCTAAIRPRTGSRT